MVSALSFFKKFEMQKYEKLNLNSNFICKDLKKKYHPSKPEL